MNRWILVMTAAWACWTSTAIAEDYLLRLEVVGCRDQSLSVEMPRETVHHRVEVLTRPGTPFHTKVKLGAETLTFRGELRPAKDEHFPVEFHFHHITQTERPDADSEPRRAPPEEMKLFTTVRLPLDAPQTAGRAATRDESPGRPAKRSRSRIVLRLMRYNRDMD